jgi:hypothetical protein
VCEEEKPWLVEEEEVLRRRRWFGWARGGGRRGVGVARWCKFFVRWPHASKV